MKKNGTEDTEVKKGTEIILNNLRILVYNRLIL